MGHLGLGLCGLNAGIPRCAQNDKRFGGTRFCGEFLDLGRPPQFPFMRSGRLCALRWCAPICGNMGGAVARLRLLGEYAHDNLAPSTSFRASVIMGHPGTGRRLRDEGVG